MSKQSRNIEEFRQFAQNTSKAKDRVRLPNSERSYQNRYGRNVSSLSFTSFDKEEIRDIIEQGDPREIRELSRYYARFCGEYAAMIEYKSSLLSYTYLLTPHYNVAAAPKKLKTAYFAMAKKLKEANLDALFPRINRTILLEGVFFGLMKELSDGRMVAFRLPCQWCRSRFRDENDLPILEINLQYFTQVATTEADRKKLLNLFPKYIQQKYRSLAGKDAFWAEIPPVDGGICFCFNDDMLPPFISATIAAEELQAARGREEERDENELHKLLIQKLPIDKSNGELLFTLPEAEELHNSVCGMMADRESIDVLTTYADVKLESVQDADTAASSSQSRLDKYTQNIYNELGISQEIFNSGSGSTALTYSIKKDIASLYAWSKQYEVWINAYLRGQAKGGIYFTIRLLPISSIFKKEDLDMFLKAAQYGYPKTAVAAALGIDTLDLIHQTDFENNILNMTNFMVPLSSSYTQSGVDGQKNLSQKSGESTPGEDINSEGGRPALDISERADRTQQNIDGMT